MHRSPRIYLAGSIKKGNGDTRDARFFWAPKDEAYIHDRFSGAVQLLNPAKTAIRRNDYLANYGCDLALVKSSDLILVDLREEKGIGVGAELMFARYEHIPVVGWAPRNSQYRRDFVQNVFGEDLINWTHPFVFGLCDYIEGTLPDACNRMLALLSSDRPIKKMCPTILDALSYFRRNYPDERPS